MSFTHNQTISDLWNMQFRPLEGKRLCVSPSGTYVVYFPTADDHPGQTMKMEDLGPAIERLEREGQALSAQCRSYKAALEVLQRKNAKPAPQQPQFAEECIPVGV